MLLTDHYVGETLGELWGYRTDGLFKTDEEAARSQAPVSYTHLYFFNESLDGITAQLARCFDQKIIITDPELAGVRFYAFFTNNESLLKILGTLNTDKSMSIRERNDVIYISRKK